MTKNYFFKIFILFVFFCQFFTKAQAQNYAIGGTAGSTLTGSVYWLTWDPTITGSKLITSPAGATAQFVINGTYVWQYSPTVRITAIITNLAVTNGNAMQAYTPGNFTGDGLDLLYSGNNLPKPGSRGVAGSALATSGNSTVTFDIDVKVAILINGVYTDIVYPGMVIADAESIDSQGEFISGSTPNSVAWQLLNKRTQNDPSDSRYLMDLSNSGRSFRLRADLAPGNFGVQAVMFARGARNIQNLSMLGSGITAMGIGFVLPFDLGDAPSTYGTAGHYIDNFAITDVFSGDGTYSVVNYPTTPLVPQANVFIGSNNVDADGDAAFTTAATNDDLNGNNDESTLNPLGLPDIKVNQPGGYSVSMPVSNGKGIAATLYGWIDFNNDGVFGPTEVATVTVPANTNSQVVTLTYPNSQFTNVIKAGTLYARFRITTTGLLDDAGTTADDRATDFAADGEAEDYKLKDIVGVTISGTVHNDPNGNLDAVISGTGLQSVAGSQLFAYLVSGNLITAKATVSATGTYSFTNVNNGTYTVAISTNNVAVGSALATVAANLPSSWVASGEAFGTNNSAGSGIETGTPNLQILVSTPGSNLDVSGLDFGIDQAPVAVTDNVTAVAGSPLTINVLANDTDADGTIDVTQVRVVDPADNTAKTSVTIANQGTYTVNTTTGAVTFTPLATFSGASTPVTYTIRDNFGAPSASNVTAQISVSVRPAGVNDSDVTLINTAVTTTVKTNDGSSNASATVTPTATSTNGGTTSVNASGQVTYTPPTGFTGIDTYTYTLTNGALVSDPITVTITVSATPIGVADAGSTLIGVPITTGVLANDGSFSVGSTVTIATTPARGTVVRNPDNTITYTPDGIFTGIDTYTYTLTKNSITSAPITVSISVVPVGVNDVVTTPINTAIATTVKANDGNSGITTTVTNLTIPTNGTASVNANVVTYTPTANFIGTDSYTYTLTTNDGVTSSPVTVNISVRPVGVADASTTAIGTPVATTVLTNDGISGTSATVTPTNGANGTTVNNAGVVTFTPAANFVGVTTYTYTLTKNGVVSDPITVTITVTPAGVADAVTTPFNTAVATAVLANDGASGTGATVTPITGANGTLANNAGVITFTPTTGFVGVTTYAYTLTNNGATSAPITVTVTVRPVGVADASTTIINNAIATSVITNDGPSATGATVTAGNGTNGTTTVNGGVVTYTPATNFVGVDTYTYTLTNNTAVSDPITVTVTVNPVATADAALTNINTPVATTVVTNDGPSATGATVTNITTPTSGTATLTSAGVITYTPAAGFMGIATYTYTLTRNGVSSAPATVTVSVKPVGVADNALTAINTPVGVTVKTNDGASGTGTTITAGNGTNGTTTVNNTTGVVTYTPATGFTGIDTYTYVLTTADGVASDPVTVTITVSPRPVGVADAVVTNINTAITTTVLANDGADGVGATVAAGPLAPANGTRTINLDGTIGYAPNSNFIGIDTYSYTITKNTITSNPILVTVSVRPVGVNDASLTNINTATAITVKANDGPSGIGTTVSIGTPPAHGTTAIDAQGVVTYTPTTGYTGLDNYTYLLTTADGVTSAPINVVIGVRPVGAPDLISTPQNTPVNITVKANDGDSGVGTTINISQPGNGTATLNATTGVVTYTPTAGYIGSDNFTYILTTADNVASNGTTVTINVAPVGVADVAATTINTSVTTNVKANDGTGVANAVVLISTQPANGTLVNNIAGVIYTPNAGYVGLDSYSYTLTIPGGGTSAPIPVSVTVAPVGVNDASTTNINTAVATSVKTNDGASGNGTIITVSNGTNGTTAVNNATSVVTYTPANNFIGLDSYTYTLTTADGVVSAPITVNITVKPVGVADAASVTINTPATFNVKTNDGASATGTTVAATTPAHGTLVVNATTGVITFTPTTGYSGPDTFTYTLRTADGVLSDPITVTLTVGGPLPVGSSDLATTTINTATTTTVLTNDADGVGAIVAAGTTVPANGNILVNANGTITYTPATNYVGLDSYTYTITKNGQTSSQILVTVRVIPTGVIDAASTTVNTPVSVSVKTNDGPSGNTTTISVPGLTTPHGTITVNQTTGVITYTPTTGYTGPDTFTYTLLTNDGVASDPITVSLSIGGALPIGQPDEFTTNINTPITSTVTTNDPNGAGSTVAAGTTVPAHGAIVVNANGTITYTPTTGYTGKDIYTYTITNAGQTSAQINVTINIKPVGSPDATIAALNTPVTISVRSNDVNTTSPILITTSTPLHGTITITGGQIVYTPTAGYTGPDSFTYVMTTGDGVASDPITVNLTVSSSAGVPDADATNFRTPVTTNVKSNDGPTAATSTVAIATAPTRGTAVVNSDGSITYTPASNFVGLDTYTYRLTSSANVVSDPITVTISVKPVGIFDGATTAINTPVTTTVRNNDGPSSVGTTVVATNGARGTVVVNANGSVTYRPETNYTGTDTYTYVLQTSDGVVSDPISVTVSVRLIGVADAVTTGINTPVTTNVKANDGVSGNGASVTPTDGTHGITTVDANGLVTYTPDNDYAGVDTYTYTLSIPGAVSDPITVTVDIRTTGVADAVATVVATPVTYAVKTNDGTVNAGATVTAGVAGNGTVTVDASGQVTYTPNDTFVGVDNFTYTLTLNGSTSAPIPVNVTVAPAGTPDVYTTFAGQPVPTPFLTNDGVSGQSATFTTTIPANGTLTTVSGGVNYTPNAGFVGTDTFNYTLTKNGITSSPILVTINVRPLGVADVRFTPKETPITIDVKANDGAPLAAGTVTLSTNPPLGTVVINANGTITYTPRLGFVGTETFDYIVTVNGQPSAPIAVTITTYLNAMTLTKVANNTVSKVGDVINYTITVRNTGTSTLTNVIVTDLGADAGSVTPANIASLAPGATATVTAKHTLTQADVDAGGYVNQANVTATDPNGNPVVGPPSDDPGTPGTPGDGTTTPIVANTAIKLTKTGVATINTITYTFLFENTGNTTISAVSLTDTKLGINSLTMILPVGGLLPGQSFTYTSVYTLTEADKAAGSVNNSASASASGPTGGPVTSTGPTGTTTTPLPAGPTAVDDAAKTSSNQPVFIPVLGNDKPGAAAIDNSTVVIVTPPKYGTVTVNPDGTMVYTPGTGFPGTDTYTYRVKDINGYFTNVAIVTVTGNVINLTPPTLFTPNGDGINDTFEIRGLSLFAVNDIEIQNRWGNQVYKTTNYQNNWTGNGLNEGTYYYILRVKLSAADADWTVIKGWTTLLRTFKK